MKKPIYRLKKNHDGTYDLQEKGVLFGWNTYMKHTFVCIKRSDGHSVFSCGYVNLSYEDAKRCLEEQQAYYEYKPEYLYPPLPEEEPK